MSTEYIKQATNNPGADSKMKAQEDENFESCISSTREEGDGITGNDGAGYEGSIDEQIPYNIEGESLW